MSEYPLTIRYVLDDEWMDCLIEMAGYGIGYWAQRAWTDEQDTTYTVVWWDESEKVEKQKTVTRGGLARGVQKILARSTRLNASYCEQVMAAVLDAGDIDADVADHVIQVAMFGDIVYG